MKAQTGFVQINTPYNAPGFKTVWCGTGDNVNKLFVHEPGYPAYRSDDGGINWIQLSCGPNIPQTDACGMPIYDCYNSIDFRKNIYTDLCFLSFGIAVGNNGLLLESRDNGDSWEPVEITNGLEPPAQDYTICESDAYFGREFFAAGEMSTLSEIFVFKDPYIQCDPILLRSSSNDKHTINAISHCYPKTEGVAKIMVSGNDGYLATDNGTRGTILTPINAFTDEDLLDIFMYTSMETEKYYFTCGANGTLIYIEPVLWSSYHTEKIELNISNNLYGIAMAPNEDIYVVGSHGLILKSSDKFATWTIVPSGTTNDLLGIDINEDAIYIVGANSTILKKSF
ncbi:hypothetical protein HXX01_04060 [Candidatus Nomurabacteria bacterium]|nr:hypothetical protein [Candidatus Nomurabacteria bacterium]